ncbi:hypothetical protein EDC04DRAFT_2996523 [Pisolithus marmoratus]|nr:hypothetical protein EDC04DRAFT_2996523 [Pisolithus marmoratus]
MRASPRFAVLFSTNLQDKSCWKACPQQQRIEIVSQSNVQAVTFIDEGQVIGGYGNGDVRRWKIEDGQQQGPTMQVSGSISCIAISQDGRRVVSGDSKGKVIVWNAANHEKVHEITEDEHYVCAVDISGDCTRIASVDYYSARIFSIASGARLLPPLTHYGAIGIRFSPDSSRFASASYDHGFRIYNTNNGDILYDSGPKGSPNTSPSATPLAWSSDGQQLFIASISKITSFDLSDESYSEWSIHETRIGTSIVGSTITHTTLISCVALSPSGEYLACGSNGGKITIHNLADVLHPDYFVHGSRTLPDPPIPLQPHPSRLPLIQVSEEALKSWTQGEPTNTEVLLSEEIAGAPSPSHYLLANRALIRAGLKHWPKSLQIQPSPIGYIAMAVALLGTGDRKGALCTFDLAFHDCEPHDIRLLLLLKLILVFESGDQEEAITHVDYLVERATNDNEDHVTYLYTQVLGVMYMKKGHHGYVIPSIECAKNLAPKDTRCPPLETISLIFGWSFNGLAMVAQQRLCETLYADEHIAETVKVLLNILRTPKAEIQASKETTDWIKEFTTKCALRLEHDGDAAFKCVKLDDAITQYSTALSLSPPSRVGLFIKRSHARAAKGLWEDALQDANEAVKADHSCPWGYEAKHMALHGARRYDEAIDAFKSMLQVIERSRDPEIRQLRKNYISPSVTIAAIDDNVRENLKSYPLVVIDVSTGCLCDSPERVRIFKASMSFKELVSSMTRELDNERILRVVARFFGYVTLSHVWQGNEPSFQEVHAAKSVWNLSDTPLSAKLRNFCEETRRLGHNWAWSDTCCIDKGMSSILNESVTSMYKWYADSAATLVFLSGVAHPSRPGDLTRSLWMTRAWTLQELLSPKIIFFYDSTWKPYLGDTGKNHKEFPEIMQELADALKIPCGTIIKFSPDDLGVQEKLRLASTRHASVEEDVAYSLIGIFKSDIRPHYGEGEDALGHLLEEVVSRSGEVIVLAWSGRSSSYNSCLPASVSVYSKLPYNPPPLEGDEMETCIAKLRGKLLQQVALQIYHAINLLPPVHFATRRLRLPCITFRVKGLRVLMRSGNENLYRAKVSGLGNVEFMTTDDLPLDQRRTVVFVHPWIRHILAPSSGVCTSGSDTSESGSGHSSRSDGPTPFRAVPESRVGGYARALQIIARLGQPFNALLLVGQPNGEYRRVAADHEIVVQGPGIDITSKSIRAKVLEIL